MKSLILRCLAYAALLACPVAALAQTSGSSRDGPTRIASPDGETRRFPTIFGAASAFPSVGGTGFVALTLVNPRQGIAGLGGDGDAVLGYTIGNPIRNLSATFGLTITSLKDFGQSGSVSLNLSRALHVGDRSLTFAGVSASNLAAWGDARQTGESYSAYVSHLVAARSRSGEIPIQLTIGYGNLIAFDRAGLTVGDGAFAGIGVGVARNLSLSLSATETQLNAGLGVSVPGLDAASVTMGVFDVTDRVGRRQFAVSLSYAF